MIANLLQSIGIVFSLVAVIILSLVALYLSYLLAIGVLLIGGTYVVYFFLTLYKTKE